ncbi:hypothetical protein MRX96_042196 [Rhipicephalus microplus]
MGCSEETRLAAGDGAGEPGTEAEPPTSTNRSLDDEGRSKGVASEGARPLRHREARDAAGGGESEQDEEVVVELPDRRARTSSARRPGLVDVASQVIGQATRRSKSRVTDAKEMTRCLCRRRQCGRGQKAVVRRPGRQRRVAHRAHVDPIVYLILLLEYNVAAHRLHATRRDGPAVLHAAFADRTLPLHRGREVHPQNVAVQDRLA